MRTTATLELRCRPEVVFPYVASLDRYPGWMSLVHRVAPDTGRVPDDRSADDDRSAAGSSAEGPTAWDVELRARVGPLARSKRLRMVRSQLDEPRLVVFERAEIDGRHHAEWRLTARVDEVVGPASPETGGDAGIGSRLTMELVYGGALWTGGVLQRILDEEIRRASERLVELVSDAPTR